MDLAKRILSNLNNATEELNKKGKAVFLIVAPQIRRHVSRFVRAQISSVNVLSFTELPEDRSVEIAYTLERPIQMKIWINNKKEERLDD